MPISSPSFSSEGVVLDRRTLILGSLTCGVALALGASAEAAELVGSVDQAAGRSTGLLEGLIRVLTTGSDVFLEEIVQTGEAARLAIALGADTRLRLGERTRIRIERSLVERGGELILARGAMLFDRPNANTHPDVAIKTPFAVIAARGTRFFAGPSNEVFGVFVEHGIVTVRNRAGRVTLRRGLGTDLTSADIAPTPPKPWGTARISAALASVS
jgi:ferric-dicitrate binding protein FerR (iron transport regulator)